MKLKSVLLALDGSAQCYYAGELAFAFCERTGASLTACHAVNTPGIWEFLGYDMPGYIGSGPYMEVREQVKDSLLSLGQSLITSFESRASSRGIEVDCLMEEGNPVRTICEIASDFDLVITGHQPSGLASPAQERRRFPRPSVAELLACYCPRPLLVVQDQCNPWTSIKSMIWGRQLDQGCIEWCARLGESIGIPHQVECWVLQEEAMKVLSMISRLQKGSSNLKDLDLEIVEVESGLSWCSLEVEHSELAVIPTTCEGGLRKTVFGSDPDKVLRYCTLPTLLFYPQKHSSPGEERSAPSRAETVRS